MAIFGSKKSWQGQEATGLPPPPAGGATSGLRGTRISMATPAWHEPRVISTCLVILYCALSRRGDGLIKLEPPWTFC